jgi:hypothetical protein
MVGSTETPKMDPPDDEPPSLIKREGENDPYPQYYEQGPFHNSPLRINPMASPEAGGEVGAYFDEQTGEEYYGTQQNEGDQRFYTPDHHFPSPANGAEYSADAYYAPQPGHQYPSTPDANYPSSPQDDNYPPGEDGHFPRANHHYTLEDDGNGQFPSHGDDQYYQADKKKISFDDRDSQVQYASPSPKSTGSRSSDGISQSSALRGAQELLKKNRERRRGMYVELAWLHEPRSAF